jgi:hypothetical protein
MGAVGIAPSEMVSVRLLNTICTENVAASPADGAGRSWPPRRALSSA